MKQTCCMLPVCTKKLITWIFSVPGSWDTCTVKKQRIESWYPPKPQKGLQKQRGAAMHLMHQNCFVSQPISSLAHSCFNGSWIRTRTIPSVGMVFEDNSLRAAALIVFSPKHIFGCSVLGASSDMCWPCYSLIVLVSAVSGWESISLNKTEVSTQGCMCRQLHSPL